MTKMDAIMILLVWTIPVQNTTVQRQLFTLRLEVVIGFSVNMILAVLMVLLMIWKINAMKKHGNNTHGMELTAKNVKL